tara:strand:- start:33 stop:455 length:423 start_codon:yes stop_codon:yes gene_type:complete
MIIYLENIILSQYGSMGYSEKVMDHFRNPRNVGELPDADAVGTAGNPVCGDLMTIFLKIKKDQIEDIKFMTFGCGAAIASSSMATELIKGKSLDEAANLSKQAIADSLDGLPPIKMHCSVLATEAIEAALKEYYSKHPKK